MKSSIRNTRFTIGMVVFLGIILLLSICSAFYLNRLSAKTNAILKENHYSVVYAQDMSEYLININQIMVSCFLTNNIPDSSVINKEFVLFNKSLELEKKNITEPGEDKLVSGIESDYIEYQNSVKKFMRSPDQAINIIDMQNNSDTLYQQLIQLSHMNEKAIEEKTEIAKIYAKKATLQMTFIGTICFLIAYAFTFIFSSYFNERFYQLYNGIKEMVSSNYRQRLYIDGNDELVEISMAFNEMAEKLNQGKQKISLNLQEDIGKKNNFDEIQELKSFLNRIKGLEKQTIELISRFETK